MSKFLEGEKEAIRRIFLTKEGQVLADFLQRVRLESGPSDTCALHTHNGMRILAAQIVNCAEEPKFDGSSNGTKPESDASPGDGTGRDTWRERRAARRSAE